MSEVPETIPSLWPTVQQWLVQHPQHLAPGNLMPAFLDGPIDDGPFALQFKGRPRQQQVLAAESSSSNSGGSGSGSGSGSGNGGKAHRVPPLLMMRQYTGCHFW